MAFGDFARLEGYDPSATFPPGSPEDEAQWARERAQQRLRTPVLNRQQGDGLARSEYVMGALADFTRALAAPAQGMAEFSKARVGTQEPLTEEENYLQDQAVKDVGKNITQTMAAAVPFRNPVGAVNQFNMRGGQLYSVVGPNAKGVNLNLLKTAKDMAKQGAGPEEIRAATSTERFPGGFERNAANQWTLEVPDAGSHWAVDPHQLQPGARYHAESVYNHPKLYAAAPELARAEIRIADYPGMPSVGGHFLSGGGPHGLNPREVQVAPTLFGNQRSPGDMRKTFLHELGGHGAADLFGLPMGGSPASTIRQGMPEWDLYKQALKREMMPPTRAEAEATGLLDPERGFTYETLIDMHRLALQNPAERAVMDQYARQYGVIEGYKRRAGEVQARAIEERADFTPQQIKETPIPWSEDRARPDQIVEFSPFSPRQDPQFSIAQPKNAPGFGSILSAVKRASPEEINKAAIESAKGGTQADLRKMYLDLGLTQQGPASLVRPSLAAAHPAAARKLVTDLKLADREAIRGMSQEQKDTFIGQGKLPSQLAAEGGKAEFAPVKAEVKKAEAEFDANVRAGIKPSIFDLSAKTLMKQPDVPQFNLPRIHPEVTDKIRPADFGGVERLEWAARQAPMENWGWYNTMQARKLMHALHGPEKGEQVYNAWLDGVGGTSMVNPIDNNIRSSTWYLQQILQGKPLPEAVHLADPVNGKMVQTLLGAPPPGYGAKAQIQHAQRVREYLTGAYDPVANPKPISYRYNLGGNWMPRTVDTHDVRNMLGMPYAKEAFGENSNMLPKEYAYLEMIGQRASDRIGRPQAGQQAATWVGGGMPTEPFFKKGGYTELKSYPAPLMEALNRRAHVTAQIRGITPEEAITEAFTGKRPLLGIGGMVGAGAVGGAAMGGLSDQSTYEGL